MGIQGLLPELKAAVETLSLKELRGQTCAVDVYAWIHRGVYNCATELCLQGQASGYVTFCLNMLQLLQSHDIRPIMVFDGAPLGAKRHTEHDRLSKRTLAKEQGLTQLQQGKQKEAHASFSKAVDVTPEMARQVLIAFRHVNIKCIVAPHEADAQLARLMLNQEVDFVISEDSDMLAFGCQRVLFKLDRHTGLGDMLDMKNLHVVHEWKTFTDDMFLDCCILAGCDYVSSVRGIGIKRAVQLVSKYRTTSKILRGLRFECRHEVIPPTYEMDFHRARMTFRHQVVFDKDSFTHLRPLPSLLDDMSVLLREENNWAFLGNLNLCKDASSWAMGDIHPVSLEKFNTDLDCLVTVSPSKTTTAVLPLAPPQQPKLEAFFSVKSHSSVKTNNPWVSSSSFSASATTTVSTTTTTATSSSKFFIGRNHGSKGGPPSKYTKLSPSPAIIFPPLERSPLFPLHPSLPLTTPAAKTTVFANFVYRAE